MSGLPSVLYFDVSLGKEQAMSGGGGSTNVQPLKPASKPSATRPLGLAAS
jgi:hypothetical protein